jgi:energy-coupling factor transporter ATP-binding protein EcfA2
MIEGCEIRNFGPLSSLNWNGLGPINLVIGGNGCGKSFVLKSLYVAMRTLEIHGRGNEPRTAAQILADKLYWTFQPARIGDLVSKNSPESLHFSSQIDGREFSYGFGRDTKQQIQAVTISDKQKESNSVFLPAKEVLSLHHLILQARERDQLFGFDDTYYDLALALRHGTKQGKNFSGFAKARQELEAILDGRVIYEPDTGQWIYKKGNQRFAIGVTAEGIKIGILDTLLGNRTLSPGSVVFIDEPEAALHPQAISRFLEIVAHLAQEGLQFFLASHSYFALKQLRLLAINCQMSIPVLSSAEGCWQAADLRDGMPENPIFEQVGLLYERELEAVLL